MRGSSRRMTQGGTKCLSRYTSLDFHAAYLTCAAARSSESRESVWRKIVIPNGAPIGDFAEVTCRPRRPFDCPPANAANGKSFDRMRLSRNSSNWRRKRRLIPDLVCEIAPKDLTECRSFFAAPASPRQRQHRPCAPISSKRAPPPKSPATSAVRPAPSACSATTFVAASCPSSSPRHVPGRARDRRRTGRRSRSSRSESATIRSTTSARNAAQPHRGARGVEGRGLRAAAAAARRGAPGRVRPQHQGGCRRARPAWSSPR